MASEAAEELALKRARFRESLTTSQHPLDLTLLLLRRLAAETDVQRYLACFRGDLPLYENGTVAAVEQIALALQRRSDNSLDRDMATLTTLAFRSITNRAQQLVQLPGTLSGSGLNAVAATLPPNWSALLLKEPDLKPNVMNGLADVACVLRRSDALFKSILAWRECPLAKHTVATDTDALFALDQALVQQQSNNRLEIYWLRLIGSGNSMSECLANTILGWRGLLFMPTPGVHGPVVGIMAHALELAHEALRQRVDLPLQLNRLALRMVAGWPGSRMSLARAWLIHVIKWPSASPCRDALFAALPQLRDFGLAHLDDAFVIRVLALPESLQGHLKEVYQTNWWGAQGVRSTLVKASKKLADPAECDVLSFLISIWDLRWPKPEVAPTSISGESSEAVDLQGELAARGARANKFGDSPYVSLARVNRALEAIRRLLRRRNSYRAEQFFDELISDQRKRETPKRLVAKTATNAATAARDEGFFYLAKKWFDLAVTISADDDPVARCGYADVLKALGDLDAAKQMYAETMQMYPQDAVARNGYASVLRRQGDYRGALAMLPAPSEDLQIWSTQNAYDAHLRAIVLLDSDQLFDCVHLLQVGISKVVDRLSKRLFQRSVGWVALRQGRVDDAIACFAGIATTMRTSVDELLMLHARAIEPSTIVEARRQSTKLLALRLTAQENSVLFLIRESFGLAEPGSVSHPLPANDASYLPLYKAEAELLLAA